MGLEFILASMACVACVGNARNESEVAPHEAYDQDEAECGNSGHDA